MDGVGRSAKITRKREKGGAAEKKKSFSKGKADKSKGGNQR